MAINTDQVLVSHSEIEQMLDRLSSELNRLLTDLKVPESARSQILFIRKGGEILWLPGFGHGIGFTNAVSYGKCIAERQSEGKPETFVRIAIERQ